MKYEEVCERYGVTPEPISKGRLMTARPDPSFRVRVKKSVRYCHTLARISHDVVVTELYGYTVVVREGAYLLFDGRSGFAVFYIKSGDSVYHFDRNGSLVLSYLNN